MLQEDSANFKGTLNSVTDAENYRTSHTDRPDRGRDGSLFACCRRCLCNVFRKKTLYERLPICRWLPGYSRKDAVGDLIAGITVGLLVVPQGLAYAGVAGLPSQFGLYGAFLGSFIYVLLGTCKDNTVGSTAIASLMVFQVANGVWQRAVLLTFLTGIIEILMAVFRLSFLVDFISGPVSAGFSSAAACIVFTSQVKNILGVNGAGSTFVQRWISIVSDIQSISVPDTVLGAVCIVILLMGKYIARVRFGPSDKSERSSWQSVLNGVLWFIGTTRIATLVISCALLSRRLDVQGRNPFKLTGFIPPGLPPFNLPPFSIPGVPGNVTAGVAEQPQESFSDMVQNLGYAFLIVPIVAMVENNAVCKVFARGNSIDATQELFVSGVANIANSLVSGYRSNGGLTRATISNASGARTPMTNLYIGLVVVMALLFLTDFFFYIPRAVLAAVIVAAVIFQIQYQLIGTIWRSKRSDLIPGLVSFFACLILRLEEGIFTAIGVNLLFILYHSARPKVDVEITQTTKGQRFLKLTPDRCLIFPSADFVRQIVTKESIRTRLPVVFDCSYVYGADYTAAKAIASMVADFVLRRQQIIFFNLKASVAITFEGLNAELVTCYSMEELQEKLSDVDSSDNGNNRF